MANLGKFKLIYPCADAEKMENYEKLQHASLENWEDFTTGRRRKHVVNTSNAAAGKTPLEGKEAVDTLDANGKPIWKASGTVVNYMPAWERNFQRSLQQKQARLNSLQQQSSAENPTAGVLSARQQDSTSARAVLGPPFK